MVTITDYKTKENAEGKPFSVFELTGGIEVIQSQTTGKLYATARKCTLLCTVDEETAKAAIGTTLPGTIERVEADVYDYAIPSTGEVVKLNYRYEYVLPAQEPVKKTYARPRPYIAEQNNNHHEEAEPVV